MASQDMMIIVVMMMMMSSVFVVLAGGAFFLNRPEEGDECDPKNPDPFGYYVIDEDGKCVLDYCSTGYSVSATGRACVKNEDDDSGGGGGGGGSYVYEFIVNVQNEHKLRLHLADIKMDGVRPDESQVEIKIPPNRYMCHRPNVCESEDTLGYIDAQGPNTWSAWDEEDGSVYGIGDVIFTVTSPTKVSEFEISYQRPKYAPGWIIKENGNVVLTEPENRGADNEPTPVTYKYTIP
jgi:hypothetical protein